MPRFCRFAHEMEYAGAFVNIEIEIHFRTALVGVWRHGVPNVALRQLGNAHDNLATVANAGANHLIERAFICVAIAAEINDVRFFFGDFFGGIRRMCGITHHIKFCRICRIVAGKLDGFAAAPDVQAIFIRQRITSRINCNFATAANVDHTDFPPFGEVVRPQFRRAGQRQRFDCRHHRSDNRAIHIDVMQHNFSRRKQIVQEIRCAKLCRGHFFATVFIPQIAYVHKIAFHLLSRKWFQSAHLVCCLIVQSKAYYMEYTSK